MNKVKWVVVAVAAAMVLVVGGTWVYINVIREDPPERLAFDADETTEPTTTSASGDDPSGNSTTTTQPATLDSVEGTWSLTSDSVVGYRVGEVLFGQTTEGVGRTSDVTGQMTIDGTTVTQASFEVDMATFESDDNRRDGQFRGRIMDVATHPTATLVLVEPIELGAIPADREVVETAALVELTLRGTTQTVPVQLRARLNGSVIEVDGAITIVFAEWGIPNPSTAGISTEDFGELEFVLVFEPT